MKIRLLLGLLLVMLFTADAAQAQHYRHHYRGGYGRGYHSRGPRAVVVINPGGPRYHHRGYYGRGYRRGYYAGPRRGYYGHRHGYYGGGPRRHFHRRY